MRVGILRWASFLLLASIGVQTRGDAFDPPAAYYDAATGTGATLKQQLNNIIDGHTDIGYDGAKIALGFTDADPNNSNNLITVYDRTSISKVWDSQLLIWNREHVWPRSRGISDSGPDDSDLFNLRPALTAGNGARQNFNFGGTFPQASAGLVTTPNPDEWYPGNADAGMIARQMFYMAVRYDGVDNASNTSNLELANDNPAASQTAALLGDKDRLIEWHYLVPPDNFERNRNQVIYTSYQHNRDPFIDHPEWVWSVFMDDANDSQISLAGAVVNPDGSSGLGFDMGRRLVGSTASQSVMINKTGADGAYFRVTPTGHATSTITGPFNAFAVGGPGSKSPMLGLPTNTAGLKTGTVSIDNLDITMGGGDGHGGKDADDIVSLSSIVLDHANPSFAGPGDLNSLTHNFGTVTQGSTATFGFDIYNLPATASYTAGLDLDGIVGSGHTSVLTTNLATFGGGATLAAGDNRSFVATLNTAATGSFLASYTLNFSDENLPGAATLGSLTLQLSGTVQAGPPTGDFDQDGMADGLDFLAWQRGVGMSSGAALVEGDGDHNGAVNGDDLTLWQNEFGLALPAAAAVPEPSAVWLAVVGATAALISRQQRHVR